MLGAIDEFTADLISEGTHEGLAAARAQGRVGGRPSVMTPTMIAMARRMLEDGYKPGQIAKELRVGRATVYRHLSPATPQTSQQARGTQTNGSRTCVLSSAGLPATSHRSPPHACLAPRHTGKTQA